MVHLLFESEEIEKRLTEYISEMHKDHTRGGAMKLNKCEGPEITADEVERVRKRMRDKKTSGIDGITTEVLKALDGTLKILTKLCNKIYSTGHIPNDMTNSIFATPPKKQRATVCTDFRTISLMSHVIKLLLRIILDCIEQKVTQSGFKRGKGTREGIFNLRTILKRYLEIQRDVYVCFIDYQKAFDRVYDDEITKCFEMIDMDSKDKRLIGNLYWEQQATVRIDNGISFFPVKSGA